MYLNHDASPVESESIAQSAPYTSDRHSENHWPDPVYLRGDLPGPMDVHSASLWAKSMLSCSHPAEVRDPSVSLTEHPHSVLRREYDLSKSTSHMMSEEEKACFLSGRKHIQDYQLEVVESVKHGVPLKCTPSDLERRLSMGVYAYVFFSDIEDRHKLGWMEIPTGIPERGYTVLMWHCNCKGQY